MKLFGVILLLYFMSFFVYGNDIKIGVYRSHNIHRIDFSYYHGSYLIFGDTIAFGALLPNEFISISKMGNKVQLKKGVKVLGNFEKIILKPTGNDFSLRLRPRKPVLTERKY